MSCILWFVFVTAVCVAVSVKSSPDSWLRRGADVGVGFLSIAGIILGFFSFVYIAVTALTSSPNHYLFFTAGIETLFSGYLLAWSAPRVRRNLERALDEVEK